MHHPCPSCRQTCIIPVHPADRRASSPSILQTCIIPVHPADRHASSLSILQTVIHNPRPSYKQTYHPHGLMWSRGVADSSLSSLRHVFSKALKHLIVWQRTGACRALSHRSPVSYPRVAPTTLSFLVPPVAPTPTPCFVFPSGTGSTSLTIFGCSQPGA